MCPLLFCHLFLGDSFFLSVTSLIAFLSHTLVRQDIHVNMSTFFSTLHMKEAGAGPTTVLWHQSGGPQVAVEYHSYLTVHAQS